MFRREYSFPANSIKNMFKKFTECKNLCEM